MHGQVLDGDGEPVEGVVVRAVLQSGGGAGGGFSVLLLEWDDHSDVDGCYELRVPLGTYAVVVAPDGDSWVTVWRAGGPGGDDDLPLLTVGGGAQRLDATVSPGASLSGEVTVPSPHPATAYLENVGDRSWPPRQAPVSDGRYTFAGLTPGEYRVAVRTTVGTAAHAGPVAVEGQEKVDAVDVVVADPSVVTGRLSTTAGGPAPRRSFVLVDGWAGDRSASVPVTTDRRGRYRGDLGPGWWFVVPRVEDGCDPTGRPRLRVPEVPRSLVRNLTTADLTC